jgi:hypothetical protein
MSEILKEKNGNEDEQQNCNAQGSAERGRTQDHCS